MAKRAKQQNGLGEARRSATAATGATDRAAKDRAAKDRAAAVLAPPKSPQVFKQQARVLKALANEARLMIVDRLAAGECTVGELVELVGLDQSTVSKHLALLRSHGIVEDRREGNFVYYRLVTRCVLKFFACASEVLEVRL